MAGQWTRPSPQAQSYLLVRDINPVKTDDFFHSFFIHVMIMQALSYDVLLSSVRQEVTIQPCGWCANGELSRLSSVRVEIRMKEWGRFTLCVGQLEGRTRQSVIPSSSSSAAINL